MTRAIIIIGFAGKVQRIASPAGTVFT